MQHSALRSIPARAIPVATRARVAAAGPKVRADLPAILVAMLVCVIGSGSIVPLVRNFNRTAADMLDVQTRTGDLVLALPMLVVGALAGLRIASGHFRSTPLRAISGPAAFALLAMASCLWTDIPARTARRIGLLLAAYLAGLFFYKVLSFVQIRRIATLSFAGLTLASVVFALAVPSIGQAHELYGDFWRGLFETKNNFGTALLMASCFYASYLVDGRRRTYPLLLLVASIICAYMAGCKTAMVGILVVVLAALVLATIRRGLFKAVDLLLLGALGALGVAGLVAMGRIPLDLDQSILTFSGRTQLWTVLWDAVAVHPLLGYGYESFWRSQSDWISLTQNQAGWQATGSHNGYIEALLNTGAAGLLIFLVCLWGLLVRGWKQAVAGSNPAVFAVLLALALVVQNLTEPFVFRSGALFTVLTVYAYVAVTPLRRPSGLRWHRRLIRRAAPLPHSLALPVFLVTETRLAVTEE